MLRDRPPGNPIFKSRSLGYPELAPLLRKNEDMIGGGGSIASTFGTGNTSFATGWPMRHLIAKSEKDWSIGFAKCITNESSAGAVENKNRSDLIPGDGPVPARLRRIAIAVDEGREHPQNIPGTELGMQPLYLARIEDLRHGDLVKVDCAACHHVALLTPDFLLRHGLDPRTKVLDLQGRGRCRGCGARGRAVVSVKWARQSG